MLRKNGFTLIELMVVIVILGIISAIAIPSYQEIIRKNTEAKVQQEILKLSERRGDNSLMVILKLVDEAKPEEKKPAKKASAKLETKEKAKKKVKKKKDNAKAKSD